MEFAILIFLSSGLFLGWSLGANDAANVFGTAVGTRMVRFTTAALVCSAFVILGAVISGAGASHTLGKLGAINALGGAFMAALAAAVTVYGMTRAGLPVSTSQAIVGAIIGWNLFSGFPTDFEALIKILATWIACPLLAGLIAMGLFKVTAWLVHTVQPHIYRLDAYTRLGLILAGAFGSYSLGANNIANVMGVFVPAHPFTTLDVGDLFRLSGIQQLFLLGAIAIAAGVFTYSKKVMLTVGSNLLPLSPVGAWVVVVAHSIVLFVFASQGLEQFLAGAGLPTIPLVPVSSSQAVVGAVVGIGLLRGGRGINWKVLANIASGWVTTPVIACIVCFVALFFVQNVFNQQVYREVAYVLSEPVLERLQAQEVAVEPLRAHLDERFDTVREFRRMLRNREDLDRKIQSEILNAARIDVMVIDPAHFARLADSSLSAAQASALRALAGRRFDHRWMLDDALGAIEAQWRSLPATKKSKFVNRRLQRQRQEVYALFEPDQR